jgi:P4 family phage/plasmid primase-like protien
MDGQKYDFDDFLWLIEEAQAQKSQENVKKKPQKLTSAQNDRSQDTDHLALSEKIKTLILNGNNKTYSSRSEADQAVITVLVSKGMGFAEIKQIFETHQIGEKYREHKSQDKYLQHNIDRAKEFSNLSEQEMQDPLFISGSLRKNESGKYNIDVVRFQEYMTKKWKLKYLEDETTFFRFNGKCYEVCKRDSLNHLCQKDLGGHRGLFSIQVMGSFIHFGIAANLIDGEKASSDQTRYLTLQNGLFDLVNYELVPHNSSIYTTNLLPYDYDPTAKCPRFLQYFDEVFMGDKDTINVIQEAMGYTFYKSISKPAMFFLIGGGGNGKSVFINTLMNLCGAENASSISLNLLSREYYLLDLFGKMINVSSETPSKRLLNADQIKAVVAGDMISARKPYENPTKFRPFAKHFIAMNERPLIDDPTYGMWRRIYMIDFPRRFSEKEMDVYLTEKLKTELSGIFNWALEGFKRLRDREFRFEESNSMKASKQDYKDQSNSALSFAGECLEKSISEENLQFKKVYEEYEKYCEKDGFITRMKKKELRKNLENAGYLIENSSKHSNELRIFGVKLS